MSIYQTAIATMHKVEAAQVTFRHLESGGTYLDLVCVQDEIKTASLELYFSSTAEKREAIKRLYKQLGDYLIEGENSMITESIFGTREYVVIDTDGGPTVIEVDDGILPEDDGDDYERV